MNKPPSPDWENSNPMFSNEEIENLLRDFVEMDEEHAPKCECGSEKVYGSGSTHSDWCPKSESK
jgi:hypothetical protein